MAIVKKCRHPRSEWEQCGCQWYLDHRVGGKRIYEPIKGPDDVRPIGSFAQVAYEWLDQYKDGRWSTYSTYRGVVRRLCTMFGDWSPGEITGEVLDDFVRDAQQNLSASSARQYHDVLCAIIRFSGRTVPEHVHPKAPKPKRRVPVTTSEVRRIIEALPPETQSLGEFAALTGMRIGELLGLRPEDIEGDGIWVRRQRQPGGVVGPPKSEAGVRFVRLGPRAAALLDREGEWCFPLSYRKAETDMHRALKRAGMYQRGMGWHLLRHYNAALRERVGQGLRGAQTELGHSDATQTLSYGWGETSGEAATRLEDYFQE